jgi:hypothetical protein
MTWSQSRSALKKVCLHARNEPRALIVAAGLTDEDIDRMIAEARAEV